MLRRMGLFVGLISVVMTVACESGPPVPAGDPPLCARRFGDGASQTVTGLAVDAAGNFVIVGENGGTVDFGGGALEKGVYVAKFDPTCQHIWSKILPRAYSEGESGPFMPGLGGAPRVAVDPTGNVFVSDCFSGTVDLGSGPLTDAGEGDLVVMRLDADGTLVWSQRFGDSMPCYGASIGADAQNNVLLTGTSAGSTDFGGEPIPGAFVAKLGADGAHIWSKGLGSAWGYGIGADAAGNVTVGGMFWDTIDLGGGPMTSSDTADVFVAKLGPDGGHVWSKAFVSTTDVGDELSLTMGVAPSGEIALGGRIYGTVDFGGGVLTAVGGGDAYAAKLDATGAHVWSKIVGDGSIQQTFAVAIDGMGNTAMAGASEGTIDFGNGPIASAGKSDAFLARISDDGSAAWSRGIGDGERQKATAVGMDATGNVIMAGEVSGVVALGMDVLTGFSGDVLIAKFSP